MASHPHYKLLLCRFVMSGVIIRETNYPAIQSEMEALKRKVWNNAAGCENYILHEKDVSFANFPLNSSKLSAVASCYHIFTVPMYSAQNPPTAILSYFQIFLQNVFP